MLSPSSNSTSLTQKLIEKQPFENSVKGILGQNVKFVLPEDIQEEGIIKEIQAYRIQKFKLIFSYFLFFITGGLLYLFTRWSINLKIRLQMVQCKSSEAQFMKIISADNTISLVQTENRTMAFQDQPEQSYLIFSFRLYTYFYIQNSNCFYPIQFALSLLTNNQIYEKYGRGVPSEENLKQQVSIYGLNNTEIPDKSTVKILIDEVLSPFYIFQIFSVTLWMLEPYYYYASVIFFTSLLSAVVSLLETKNNYKKLKQMSFFETPVFVFREAAEYIEPYEGQFKIERDIIKVKKQISSLELVPGDIIEIPDGQILPCDVILLNGSCVMNESMLTGESIPIIKSSLPFNNNKYHPNEDGKQSTLFAGTKCIETRYHLKGQVPILGLVSQTSFNTMKGQLVRSILYPKQNSFSFYVDSLKFVAVLALISLFGFFFSLPFMIRGYHNGYLDVRDLVLNSLDLITITVPPALPTCLSIGISFAMSRLRKKQIFCISPPKVNICGKVTIMCFDKTGTLTEEGLDMYGLRPVLYSDPKNIKFAKLQEQTVKLGSSKLIKMNGNPEQLNLYGEGNPYTYLGDPEVVLKECMASCHGLTRINGELIGDPLEVKMFEATQWELIENNLDKFSEVVMAVVQQVQSQSDQQSQTEKSLIYSSQFSQQIGIIKRFEFSSKLQRMSTIVKRFLAQNEFYRLYVKGSPEKIFELCKPETIPQNFHEVLDFYARKGFRVLAFGIKILNMDKQQIQKVERDEVENELTFAGLLIMENKLKPITTDIIQELQSANIRTIMVTGDNALTAISVGRQCKIIDENKRVYFGDISDDPKQYNRIVWKDFENGNKILNEDNLEPVGGVVKYQEDNVPEIEEEKKIFEQAQFLEEEDRRISKFHRKRSSQSKKSIIQMNSIIIPANKKSYRERAKTISMIQQDETLQKHGMESLIEDKKSIFENSRNLSHVKSTGDKKYIEEEDIMFSDKEINEQEEEEIAALNDEDYLPWKESNESYTLAITGRAFSKIIHESTQTSEKAQLLRTMLLKTQIFARMRPEEKALLLQQLQDLPWKPTCGMCGDGANDCGALKTADVGISLSEAEASIAAPFTSKIQDISCVVELLKEGRAALVTSFSCFKFMALYSMIQFFTTTLLYTVNSLPGDMQFLYWDIVIIIPLAFLMGLTDSYPSLSKQVPGSNLVSFPVLISVIGMTLLNGGFQVIMFFVLRAQSWYMSVQDAHDYLDDLDNEDARKSCYESTTLFFFTNFQYISTCIAFSIGKPFKKEFFTNKWFTITLVFITLLSFYVQLIPDSFTRSFLNIFEEVKLENQPAQSEMPFNFLLVILGISIASAIVNILFEKFVVRKISLVVKKKKEQKTNFSIIVPHNKIET
ncbi:E1-E2 ATPase family protein (macronuclear) [Tetrahymena thermophila SB210]|uniref:Cation-transporting ATPase n=1 Tax=Tetrahymena thermophila (strain SB210) TaxID=312017 RepID=Q23QW3_TETTS|nr:E1-E2 ATPase family protein [Tetrahymena thermophila SB210]EAR98775.2 E1-E2 ATPase family protein [Tetrahymena thermophila SB210]|eukprot:XP_001019020.2 E1-E2 ATPase family protein [Tetrahymena thermophila SB210]